MTEIFAKSPHFLTLTRSDSRISTVVKLAIFVGYTFFRLNFFTPNLFTPNFFTPNLFTPNFFTPIYTNFHKTVFECGVILVLIWCKKSKILV